MRKRFISFIMTMVMAVSVNVTLRAEAMTTRYDNAFEFAKTVGLFDEISNGDSELSRGEMARVICLMLDMMHDTAGEWYDSVFKESNSDVTLESLGGGLKFEDVKPTDEFYGYIKTVTDRGILVGVNETEFKPQSPVTYMQFVKVLISLMGYSDMANMQGGYPNGYLSVAGNIGFEEISGKDYNEHITIEEAAYIIYKNLETPVASAKYVAGEGWNIGFSDDTFGEKILGIYKYKNRLNAIGNLSLFEEEYPDNTVLVGETVFKVSDGYEVDEKLFAREVNVYYKEDDGDIGPVIFAELTGKDNAISFGIDKLEEFTSDSLSFMDGAKIKKVKIKNGAYFISNGEQLLKYNKESFSFDYGEVTLIQSKDEQAYDIITVEGYNSVYVSGIDKNEQIIYCKGRTPIELSEDEENYKILKNGEEKAFSDIEINGIIDVSESGKRIKIRIPDNNKRVVKVSAIGEDFGEKHIISGDGEKIKMAKGYLESSDYLKPQIGKEYTMILNCNGDIAWIESGVAAGYVGYFLKAVKDEETERALIKLLKEDGKTEIFACTEKLSICDEDGVEHRRISPDNVKGYFINDDGSDYAGLLRYTLDKDGQIRKVEIPITNTGVNEKGKFYDLTAMHGYSETSAHFTGWTWGGLLFLSDSYTKAIFIPSADGDDSKHVVAKYGEVPTGASFKTKLYGTNPDTLEAEYMIGTQSISEGYKRPTNLKNWAVVKSRSVGYDELGGTVVDKVTIVTVQTDEYSDIKEIELTAPHEYVDKNGQGCSILDIANDAGQSKNSDGSLRTYSVGKGDIIYYSADTFNELKGLSVMYKADMKNPYAEKQEKLGWLAGTSDDYRSGNENEKKYSNPYSFSSSQLLSSGLSYICDVLRIHKVSPYKMGDYTYLSTSMDLNTYNWEDGNIKLEGTVKSHYLNGKRYPIFGYPYPTRGTTITIAKNGNVEVKAFNKADMKTADIYGKDCSTVIQFLSWSKSVGIIVINDER